MTVDLKWALPVVMPFVVLGLFRLMWWAAGAPWSEPSTAAFLSIQIGAIMGGLIAGLNQEMHWNVTVGRKPKATAAPVNEANMLPPPRKGTQ